MKAVDYVIDWSAGKVTIATRSERARKRTPETMTFKDRSSALEYVTAAEAEGYRFLGHEAIDPQKQLVRYGYFVKLANGSLVPSGQDFGPNDPVYEPGDSYPVSRGGKEGFILDVVKGPAARMNGCDIMIVIEERPLKSQGEA